MKKMRLFLLVLLPLILFSCYDEDLLDSDKIDTDNIIWKPDMISPIGYAKISFKDLVENNIGDEVKIKIEDSGLKRLYIEKIEDNIGSINMDNIIPLNNSIDIANSGVINIPIPAAIKALPEGTLIPLNLRTIGPINTELTLDLGDTDVVISEFLIDYNIVLNANPLPFDYVIELSFKDDVLEKIVKGVKANERLKFDKPFPEKIVKLSSNELKPNTISAKVKIIISPNNTTDYSSLSDLSVNMSINKIDIKEVKGDFGKKQITFKPGIVDLDLGEFNKDNIKGNLQFGDPVVGLRYKSKNIGISLRADLQLKAHHKSLPDVDLLLGTDHKDDNVINSPLYVSGTSDPINYQQSIIYSKENSNIVEFMSNFPMDNIQYAGTVSLNPKKSPDLSAGEFNFWKKDAEMSVDAIIKIPFDISCKEIVYNYTADDVDFGIDEDMRKKIQKAAIVFKAKNEWPVGVSFKTMIFKDKNGVELARMENQNCVFVPTTDTNGLVVNADEYSIQEIELSKDVINVLDKIEMIDFDMAIGFGKNGEDSYRATFTSEAIFDLTIGVHAKLDTSINF